MKLGKGRRPMSDQRLDVSLSAGLVVLVAAVATPYAVRGPGFILDDWEWLGRGRFGGVLAAGFTYHFGTRVYTGIRPGAWLLYTIQFGMIGRHPLVLYGLQTLLNAAAAVAIFAATRRLFGRPLGACVAAVWVLLPDHASLSRWLSTGPAVASLALVMSGTALLATRPTSSHRDWVAVGCLLAGAMFYEPAVPVALLAVVAAPWLAGIPQRWPVVALGWGSIGAFALANLLTHRVPSGWGDLRMVAAANFGAGIAPADALGRWLLAFAGLGVAASVARFIARRDSPSDAAGPERLVVAGLVVVGAGTLYFLKFPLAVRGISDRANTFSSVGAAMVWAGLGALVWRWRVLALGLPVVALALFVPAQHRSDLDFHWAATYTPRIVSSLRERFPLLPPVITVGPYPPGRGGVAPLLSDTQASYALAVFLGTQDTRIHLTYDMNEFMRAPAAARFDFRTLS